MPKICYIIYVLTQIVTIHIYFRQSLNTMAMLENFVKWMASLPEFEREHKIDMLINLFAPNPSRADFARLKAALNRKDDRIGQL